MRIVKRDVVGIIASLECMAELNRKKALDASDVSLLAHFSGRASAYEMCIKWIKEDILHEKESR